MHAAGVVIAPEPLENLVPLATVSNPKEKNGERILVTQFDMNTLASIGLVKMDFLGLRNLTVIQNALNRIKERRGIEININQIPLDDKKTYKLLQSGKVKGVFQLESSPGMRDFVIRMQPEVFEDLIALIAMYRPGPLQTGMADAYINRKKGIEKVEYPHPDLEEILKETYGVILYQEQVMQIAQKIGGFTKGQSDALRKAMGKKIESKMREMRVLFIEGAINKGYSKDFAENIYDQMAEFAKYGFNKSHSAAYAMIVYQTAYLKANYTIEFMTAVLDSEIDKTEKLAPYFIECKELNIKVEKPDINKSYQFFHIENDNTIRYALSAIKNVGDNVVKDILEKRKKIKQFNNIIEFLENIDLKVCNKRALESLIYAGCFDNLGYTRKGLIDSLEQLMEHIKKIKDDINSGQNDLFFNSQSLPKTEPQISEEEYEEMEYFKKEKEVLGIYFSGHPLDKYKHMIQKLKIIPIEKVLNFTQNQSVEVCGILHTVEIKNNKNKKEFARFTLHDWTGSISCIAFSNIIEQKRELLKDDLIVLIKGNAEIDSETQQITIIVEDIQELNKDKIEEKMEKSLHLKIYKESFEKQSLQELAKLIQEYRGNIQVFFHIVSQENKEKATVIKAHESFCVSYNEEFFSEIKKVPGIEGAYITIGDTIKAL
ncbi:MAG: hypothetical protein KatS3mg129_0791 [Leptospiraceae bacterium]|nr:MAG: hypothetical protein KatS3mg129_0791 [Leptospiraceae bacterium]